MTTKVKIIAAIVAVLFLFGAGYGVATLRHQSWLAGATEREQQRMAEIAAKEAEQNQLRGENKQLREHVAKLEIQDEGLRAIIESRGGAIADEAKNLEKINNELQNDQAIINAPADKCVRCRRFSERAIAAGQISRPLTCKDECAGTTQ